MGFRSMQTSVEQGFQLLRGQGTPQRPGKGPPLRSGPCLQTDSYVGSKLMNPRQSREPGWGWWAEGRTCPLPATRGAFLGRGSYPSFVEALGHSHSGLMGLRD